jgi:rod shape determining protein RodA
MFDYRWRYFDFYMLATTALLMGFGVIGVWSASGANAPTLLNPGVKQAMFGAIGIALMLIIANTDYRFIGALAWPAYFLAILVLIAVKFVGVEIAGARRWFDFGFATVQPSEFGKITTAIALAWFISSRGEQMKEFGNFAVSMLIVAVPALLVFLEPDFGSTMVYLSMWVAMMFVARTRWLYLAGLFVLSVPGSVLLWKYGFRDYQRARLDSFLNPEDHMTGEAFNLIQSRIAVGSSGLFGHGIHGGSQSTEDFLKVKTTDFIFSHVSSMFGFVGMVALFALLVLLLWRFVRVIEVSKDSFGQCLAAAIFMIVLFQSFVNIGMNIGILPVTGITLPLISQGLSSVWALLIGQGLLQSVLMRHRKLAFQPD